MTWRANKARGGFRASAVWPAAACRPSGPICGPRPAPPRARLPRGLSRTPRQPAPPAAKAVRAWARKPAPARPRWSPPCAPEQGFPGAVGLRLPRDSLPSLPRPLDPKPSGSRGHPLTLSAPLHAGAGGIARPRPQTFSIRQRRRSLKSSSLSGSQSRQLYWRMSKCRSCMWSLRQVHMTGMPNPMA